MPAGRAADAVCGMDADCFLAAKGTCRTITAAEVYRFSSHRLRSISFTPCENLCYNNHNYT